MTWVGIPSASLNCNTLPETQKPISDDGLFLYLEEIKKEIYVTVYPPRWVRYSDVLIVNEFIVCAHLFSAGISPMF
jgi:hypothetical protein